HPAPPPQHLPAPRPPIAPPFPYPTLFRSGRGATPRAGAAADDTAANSTPGDGGRRGGGGGGFAGRGGGGGGFAERLQGRRHHRRDRKSTRLNSSHVEISYAVFCLKKKKKD